MAIPSINVGVKSVYDRVFLLRSVFGRLLSNMEKATTGEYSQDALIKRLKIIVDKINDLLNTCESFIKYRKIVDDLDSRYNEYLSGSDPTHIINLYITFIIEELTSLLREALPIVEALDLNYKSGMVGSVQSYKDEDVKQPYAHFIPTDDYFAWNTVEARPVNNGHDVVFLLEDYIKKADDTVVNIFDSISIRESKNSNISLRKHGHTGDESPSKIYCKIADGVSEFDKDPELIQRDLMKPGIICDFLIDVETSGFSYGMINSKTGEKTVLIEDSYIADVKAGEDALKKSKFAATNVVDDLDVIPNYLTIATRAPRKTLQQQISADPSAIEFSIGSTDDLIYFASLIHWEVGMASRSEEYGGRTFKLTDNIDMSGVDWTPIGGNQFRGNIDGQGYSIMNLSINRPDQDYVGFFSIQYNGITIKNILFKNVFVNGGNDSTGTIVGSGTVTIEDCRVDGSVRGNGGVGGLCGLNYYPITRCCFVGDVRGDEVGGIVGYAGSNYYHGVSNCYFNGEARGTKVGGIVGRISQTDVFIQNCCALGQIYGTEFAGGIIGENSSGEYAINNVSLCEKVSSDQHYGRICGRGRMVDPIQNMPNNEMLVGHDNLGYRLMCMRDNSVNWPRKGPDSRDGADVVASVIRSDPSFGNRLTQANGWTLKPGKLPGLFGKVEDIPPYIFEY